MHLAHVARCSGCTVFSASSAQCNSRTQIFNVSPQGSTRGPGYRRGTVTRRGSLPVNDGVELGSACPTDSLARKGPEGHTISDAVQVRLLGG